jgi:ATP-dependent RNA helicase DeaD
MSFEYSASDDAFVPTPAPGKSFSKAFHSAPTRPKAGNRTKHQAAPVEQSRTPERTLPTGSTPDDLFGIDPSVGILGDTVQKPEEKAAPQARAGFFQQHDAPEPKEAQVESAPEAPAPEAKVHAKAAKAAKSAKSAKSAPQVFIPEVKVQPEFAQKASAPPESTDPSKSWLNPVSEALRKPLLDRGFDALTTVQEAVLAAQIDGRDLQISSQTGSGKTVALGFVIANAIQEERTSRGPSALIIVPTRELGMQVCEELKWLFAGIRGADVASVTGGTPVFRDRQMLARGPRVLVGTPGRLLDHVKSGSVDLSGIRELVLDEADQMLDMGFREELEGILDTTPDTRRTHMVSATFPPGALRLAERYQTNPFSIEGTALGEANQNIAHEGYLVPRGGRYPALIHLLLRAGGERILIFVERRMEALDLAERLAKDGFTALPLSGELVQSQRDRTLSAFRSGEAKVLVATDVAARGLDVPDVAMVVHSTPPINAQIYTHRSGRTGRAGNEGVSALLVPHNSKRRVMRLLDTARVDFHWCRTPEPVEVRAELEARAQKALEADLDAVLARGPSQAHLAQAAGLLESRDPMQVVAALLSRKGGGKTNQPPRGASSPGGGNQSSNGSVRGAFGNSQRPGNARPSYGGQSGHGGQNSSGVRFFVNWGENQGATPGRILATVCRRGEVNGESIGSIAIHPNAATFDVQEDLAQRFEFLASRRDPRDPQIMIRKDRGPQH